MDVGAEYANYASDMTRCIPVSGRFSKRQKDVYNAVLKVMREATNMLTPGTLLGDYHKEVGKVMQSELLALGLLDQNDIDKQDPKNPAFRKYFMHGTSHYLGLDVHDVGHLGYSNQRRHGIYLRAWHLHFRRKSWNSYRERPSHY
jgi:Xaa-Pro aminopeptidase